MGIEEHTIKYTDENDVAIQLVVPWGYGTGHIPPPVIEFFENGSIRRFIFAGEGHAKSR